MVYLSAVVGSSQLLLAGLAVGAERKGLAPDPAEVCAFTIPQSWAKQSRESSPDGEAVGVGISW